jgi:hypothetical protein
LRLLGDQQGEIEVIEAKSMVKQFVNIDKETDMLNRALCERLVFLHQLSDNSKAIIQSRWALANIGCDDVLEISILLSAESSEHCIADGVDFPGL